MLIDSNIIIYNAQPSYADLRRFIANHSHPAVSCSSHCGELSMTRQWHFREEGLMKLPLMLELPEMSTNHPVKG